jgi:LacI family transcriptional regulator
MTQPSKPSTAKVFPPVVGVPGKPLYFAVREAVRGAINAGLFNPGDQLPSTKELSRQLDVSLVTVHRALTELVAAGVLRRGQGRGTYVHEDYGQRDQTAAGLRFGLVFHTESSLADYYHSQVLEGVRQAADELGVDLVLLRFGEDWRNECQGYLYVNPFEAQLDRPVRFGARSKSGMGNGGHPTMIVGASFDRPGVSCIDTDNAGLAGRAVEHLFALGHRRIAMIGGAAGVSNDRDRAIGFRSACLRLGLDHHGAMEVTGPGWRMDDEHKARLLALLRSPGRPTAIFAAGYYFALDAYEVARAAGLTVGGGLSIIGVDDPPSAEHLSPPLTTLRQPLIQIGRLAAKGLFEQVGAERPAASRTLLSAELVARASTGPAPAAAPTPGAGAEDGLGGASKDGRRVEGVGTTRSHTA